MLTLNSNTSCNKLECKICEKTYKWHSSLAKHEKSVQDANTIKPTVYDLPDEAIEETRKTFFII